jgi:predicted nucleic acid-binding protein
MFLLDTGVISGLRRPDKADCTVVAWAGAIPAASVFLSAISILEIELGALLIARRDAAQGAVLRRWIDDQLLPRFEACSAGDRRRHDRRLLRP